MSIVQLVFSNLIGTIASFSTHLHVDNDGYQCNLLKQSISSLCFIEPTTLTVTICQVLVIHSGTRSY